MQKYFPEASFVIRDPAHALRIAMYKPLQLETYYGEVYKQIIDKRHALIPDISNSPKWMAMLVGIKRAILRIPALSHQAALQVVLRHLAFAKQRMDSCADPVAKFCLMLMPIALLLSFLASDIRLSEEQRDNCATMLKKFTPKFMHAAGMSADWGLICLQFLRLFDCFDHDISNSECQFQQFNTTIAACFLDGGIFTSSRAPAASGAAPAASGATPAFITERVRQQTLTKCVFSCGSSQQIVWGPIQPDDLKSLLSSTRLAATAMLARVREDLKGPRQWFSCFAVRLIYKAASGADAETNMRRHIADAGRLGRLFKLDYRILQIEYADAYPVVVTLWKGTLLLGA